jgi:hypothetical protein
VSRARALAMCCFCAAGACNYSVEPRRRASCSDRAEGVVLRELCVQQPQGMTRRRVMCVFGRAPPLASVLLR